MASVTKSPSSGIDSPSDNQFLPNASNESTISIETKILREFLDLNYKLVDFNFSHPYLKKLLSKFDFIFYKIKKIKIPYQNIQHLISIIPVMLNPTKKESSSNTVRKFYLYLYSYNPSQDEVHKSALQEFFEQIAIKEELKQNVIEYLKYSVNTNGIIWNSNLSQNIKFEEKNIVYLGSEVYLAEILKNIEDNQELAIKTYKREIKLGLKQNRWILAQKIHFIFQICMFLLSIMSLVVIFFATSFLLISLLLSLDFLNIGFLFLLKYQKRRILGAITPLTQVLRQTSLSPKFSIARKNEKNLSIQKSNLNTQKRNLDEVEISTKLSNFFKN